MADLIQNTREGLYCSAGDFHIDPWRPVPRAMITHAHGDHARRGSGRYLTTTEGRHVLQTRMGPEAVVDTVEYGETISVNGVHVSFHPAGHVLGSAQIRVEHRGEVWTVSGDYKVAPDITCRTFEPVPCDTFITECTFGLPIYRWQPQSETFSEINRWWRASREAGRLSVVFAYALGKAQRVLAGVDPSIGPILCHGAVERVNQDYRETGIPLPETNYAGRFERTKDWEGALIVAPPSANGSVWMRKFGDASRAFVSGWMQIRGTRRRRAVDRGFVLSDHADWPGLLSAIQATGATRILATHGRTAPMVRWLNDAGYDAAPLRTEYVGERDDADVDDPEEASDEVSSTPSYTAAEIDTAPEEEASE
ncbi:ligase-associated DNA damage response exonuclease [Planctomicrobium sp. SH661]|uniref:ligase-associated DNA damage response exonuclease n=1 Tax=Planctomicrobium sp. SH661 TaxID=3448124 RepID=UPI003F5C77A2